MVAELITSVKPVERQTSAGMKEDRKKQFNQGWIKPVFDSRVEDRGPG